MKKNYIYLEMSYWKIRWHFAKRQKNFDLALTVIVKCRRWQMAFWNVSQDSSVTGRFVYKIEITCWIYALFCKQMHSPKYSRWSTRSFISNKHRRWTFAAVKTTQKMIFVRWMFKSISVAINLVRKCLRCEVHDWYDLFFFQNAVPKILCRFILYWNIIGRLIDRRQMSETCHICRRPIFQYNSV